MDRKSTMEILAEELEKVNAPQRMIENARAGLYDDYKSPVAMPIHVLVFDAEQAGLHGIAMRAKRGEFDAQKWEAEEWANSEDGKATFEQFLKGIDREKL